MGLTVSLLPNDTEHPLLSDFDDRFFDEYLYDGSDNIDLQLLSDADRQELLSMLDDKPDEPVNTKIEDRPYQGRVCKGAIAAFHAGHEGVLVEAATGAGKTVMAFLIVREMIRLGLIKKFAWTCARIALLVQAKAECAAKFPDLVDSGFFISPYSDPPKIDVQLLIDDEAQHSASSTSMNVGESLRPRYRLGLTATPFRTDRLKLLYSKVIKDAGIKQLMTDGYLATFNLYQFDKAWTPANVAACYLSDAERWGRSIAYFMSKEECYEFQRLVTAGGKRCAVVLGGQPKVTEKTLSDWRKDQYDILVNVIVLTEGFDDTRLQTVFVRPGSKGPTMQMSGRAFRRFGDKVANVVQPVLTRYPIMRLVKPVELFMLNESGRWQAQSYNERFMSSMVSFMADKMQHAKSTVMPKTLMNKMTKGRFRMRQPPATTQTTAPLPSAAAGSLVQDMNYQGLRNMVTHDSQDTRQHQHDPEEADVLDISGFDRRMNHIAAGTDSRDDGTDSAQETE